MTLHVLKAASRMNLNSIRRELIAACKEGLIDRSHLEVCLAAHSTLDKTIALTMEVSSGSSPDAPTVAS